MLCPLHDARVLSPSGPTRAGCGLCTGLACCPENELTPHPHSHPAQRLVTHSEKRGRRCQEVQSGGAQQHSDQAHTLNPKHPRNLPCILGIVPSLATWRRSARRTRAEMP